MKKLFAVLALTLMSVSALAAKKQFVNVNVPNGTEDRAFAVKQGILRGTKYDDRVFTLNVVVNGEHARMKCSENHHGCSALGPGTYTGELKGSNLWIVQTIPLTHKVTKSHWVVVGSW